MFKEEIIRELPEDCVGFVYIITNTVPVSCVYNVRLLFWSDS